MNKAETCGTLDIERYV